MRVGVNLSNRIFKERKAMEIISWVLNDTGMAPYHLEIEITEGTFAQNEEDAVRALQELKSMGVRIAIDDFGTGYSSLSYLKRYPIDSLKIDRSFIKDIGTDQDSTIIPAAIISMAHSLKLKVIAEGVETQQQLAFLHEQGCDEVQGYLVSPPIPSRYIVQLLSTGIT